MTYSHSHRSFSPVVELARDSLTVLTVSGGPIRPPQAKTVKTVQRVGVRSDTGLKPR